MSVTSYTNARTFDFSSYSPTDSVLLSADLPTRFYLRGLSVTVGRDGTANPLVTLTFQDGPGQGGNDGIFRITSGGTLIVNPLCSYIIPDDSYILIDNGLYFWSSSASSNSYPLTVTVFYT